MTALLRLEVRAQIVKPPQQEDEDNEDGHLVDELGHHDADERDHLRPIQLFDWFRTLV